MAWVPIALQAAQAMQGGGAKGGASLPGGGGFGLSDNDSARSDGMSGITGSGLDSSGWIVNIGGTQNATSTAQRYVPSQEAQAYGLGPALAESSDGLTKYALAGIFALVVVVLIARKRKA